MNICITEPHLSECCVMDLCFECVLTLPDSDAITFDIRFGNFIVVLVLFFVGLWNIISFYKSYKLSEYKYIPVMRLNNIIYAIGTGIFGLIRLYFELGKPVLIFAAIHNLCEWIFVCFAFYQNKKQREYGFFGSFCFIFIIIGLMVVVLKEFTYYALTEQVTGIGLDFMLPIVWFILYLQHKMNEQNNKNNKNNQDKADRDGSYIFLVAFIAHIIHLIFTILPLVILNFIRNQNETLNRALEFVLFLSVPITHILYTKFTTLHETYIDRPSDGKTYSYDDLSVVQYPKCIKNSFFRMLFWYILCVIIGLFPTAIIPNIITNVLNGGEFCDININSDITSPHHEILVSENDDLFNIFVGTSRAMIYNGMEQAFEYAIKSNNLIENARNFKDNEFFYFGKNMFNHNEYIFVEGWKSMESARKWINSDFDRKVFNNFTYSMIKGNELDIAGYIPMIPMVDTREGDVDNGNDIGHGAIRNVFRGWTNGCQDFFDEISNINNCDWIVGIDHCHIINEDMGERMQYWQNGMTLHTKWNYKPYQYDAIDSEGDIITIYNYSYQTTKFQRSSNITLTYNKNKFGEHSCEYIYTFQTNITLGSVENVHDKFYQYAIPFLQQRYQNNTNGTSQSMEQQQETCNIL